MFRIFLFDALLFGACAYALLRGKRDAKIIAITCIIANFASYALLSPRGLDYATVENGVLIVDLLTLGAFTLVALRSDSFWPLWVSGLQLTTSMGHALKAIEVGLMPIAYAAALRLWAYPILIILIVGTWRSHQRGLREMGAADA